MSMNETVSVHAGEHKESQESGPMKILCLQLKDFMDKITKGGLNQVDLV